MKFLATALLLATLGAHAASFDCAKAQRPFEKAICNDTKLSAADSTMAAEYRDNLAKVSAAAIGMMRADQVQWLAWAQQVCKTQDPKTAQPQLAACLNPIYAERIQLLHTAVSARGGIRFFTRTQYLAQPEDPAPMGQPDFPGFGTLRAAWPVADDTGVAWTAWNQAVAARMLQLAGPLEASSAGTVKGWDDSLAAGIDSTVTARIHSIENDRIQLTLSLEWMGHGAAHPSESFETYTWLLDRKRSLRPDDIFTAGAPWAKALAESCWKQISTPPQKDHLYDWVKDQDAKALTEVVLNVRNWTLEADGLHITYPEYSVSPRVAPMDDSIVPWTDLKPLLAPDFVQPEKQ